MNVPQGEFAAVNSVEAEALSASFALTCGKDPTEEWSRVQSSSRACLDSHSNFVRMFVLLHLLPQLHILFLKSLNLLCGEVRNKLLWKDDQMIKQRC